MSVDECPRRPLESEAMSQTGPRTGPAPTRVETAHRARSALWAGLVSASTAFCVVSVALFAGVWVGPGCQTACQGDFDCIGAGFCDQASGRCQRDCFTDEDCRNPPECRENPSACRPLGLYCSGSGRCQGPVELQEGVTNPAPRGGGPRSIEGWDDAPGAGFAFIVQDLALADQDQGFDIDGRCTASGCVDNVLFPLAEFANDQIRQGLLGGESLLLLEVVGLDVNPYTGFDESFTLKVYGAEDADEPFFPANNFAVPPGHDTCCEFRINPSSLVSPPPQARARAPAELDRGRIRSLAPVPIQFTLTVGAQPHPVVRLESVLLSGRLRRDLTSISDGLLGGAVPLTTLYSIENPYCQTVGQQRCPTTGSFEDSTLLDLVVGLLGPEPDIDLDFDGRECVFDVDGDGSVDRCCDGRGAGTRCDISARSCPNHEVAAVDEDDPSSCALPASMDDGYSLAIRYSAIRARIVGSGN